MNSCNNCDTLIAGKFCHECGQKANVGRLHLHDLVHEVWHAFTHTDKGILKLIKDLLLQPKSVYLKYFNGQRKRFFSPVLFFLVTAGLAAYLYPYVFDYEDKIFHTNNEFGRGLYHLTKYRALILLPFEALLTWALFHKRYNLAETTVFWLFCLGFTYVAKIVFIPLYFPAIKYKSFIDDSLVYLTYAIILWHALLLFGQKKLINVIAVILLVNVVYVTDLLLQLYILFGNDLFTHNPFKIHNLWDVIIKAYSI